MTMTPNDDQLTKALEKSLQANKDAFIAYNNLYRMIEYRWGVHYSDKSLGEDDRLVEAIDYSYRQAGEPITVERLIELMDELVDGKP